MRSSGDDALDGTLTESNELDGEDVACTVNEPDVVCRVDVALISIEPGVTNDEESAVPDDSKHSVPTRSERYRLVRRPLKFGCDAKFSRSASRLVLVP